MEVALGTLKISHGRGGKNIVFPSTLELFLEVRVGRVGGMRCSCSLGQFLEHLAMDELA